MSNKPESSNKRKGVTAGVVICFIAAIAAVGTYTVRNYQNRVAEKLALAEEESNRSDDRESTETNQNNLIFNADDVADGNAEDEQAASDAEEADKEADTEESQETTGETTQLNFSEGDKLLWPVNGDVVMNYSMDKTVYFATLDQYKYNPALIISSAVNDQVLSASKGLVKSIDQKTETGITVTIDMGNGYEAIYGQLNEVAVKSGDYVEAKTVLGYVSEPTKYYSVEGSNLYFEVRKDGRPVNPMEFLE